MAERIHVPLNGTAVLGSVLLSQIVASKTGTFFVNSSAELIPELISGRQNVGALEGKAEDVGCRKQDVHRDKREMLPAVSITRGGIICAGGPQKQSLRHQKWALGFTALTPVGGEEGWRGLLVLCCVPEDNWTVVRPAAVTDLLQNRKECITVGIH